MEMELRKVLDQLSADIIEIKKALIGDEFHKEGLISKVSRHERDIQGFKNKVWIVVGFLAAIQFLLTLWAKVKNY